MHSHISRHLLSCALFAYMLQVGFSQTWTISFNFNTTYMPLYNKTARWTTTDPPVMTTTTHYPRTTTLAGSTSSSFILNKTTMYPKTVMITDNTTSPFLIYNTTYYKTKRMTTDRSTKPPLLRTTTYGPLLRTTTYGPLLRTTTYRPMLTTLYNNVSRFPSTPRPIKLNTTAQHISTTVKISTTVVKNGTSSLIKRDSFAGKSIPVKWVVVCVAVAFAVMVGTCLALLLSYLIYRACTKKRKSPKLPKELYESAPEEVEGSLPEKTGSAVYVPPVGQFKFIDED